MVGSSLKSQASKEDKTTGFNFEMTKLNALCNESAISDFFFNTFSKSLLERTM